MTSGPTAYGPGAPERALALCMAHLAVAAIRGGGDPGDGVA